MRAFLFDLDGTVYRGGVPIDGAAEFLLDLRARSIPFRFLTNRSHRRPSDVVARLQQMGIPCADGEVLTSAAPAAARAAGRSVYCIGESGLTEALAAACCVMTGERPDFVVVGYDGAFSIDKLTVATRAVRAGAELIATNTDPYITTEHGPTPENGAIVAAIEAASGRTAVVAGKPQPEMALMALGELGIAPSEAILVGDNPMTDVLCGITAGTQTALILTGVTTEQDLPDLKHQPTYTVRSYAELSSLLRDTGEL